MTSDDAPALGYRHPTEDDHARLWRAATDWFDRRDRSHLPRFWLRHFGPTSWLAVAGERPVGLLIGFPSPARSSEAVLLLVATDPGARHRGIARGLVERFANEARQRGCREIRAAVWPGDPVAVRFLRSLGFAVVDIPGGQRLYGTPAVADYDGEGEDRAILVLDLGRDAA